jgi:glycosyltransferase involved in cell wall biosynthesis
MNDFHELTIVIPCKDDPCLLDCIDSIDLDCEVLVVINGSSEAYIAEMKPELNKRKVRMECLPEPNLAKALEYGVWAASYDAILFMDSDCRFESGAIAKLLEARSKGDPLQQVFKGFVCFDEGDTWLSSIIAKSRHRHTAAPKTAYKPPLLVDRRLAPKIGGYFFDARLRWKEDSDLDWRLRTAGCEIVIVPEACIQHTALSLQADLRSNFRYGIGAALGEILEIPLTPPQRSVSNTLIQDGIAVALYMALANLVRSLGYYWTLTKAIFSGKHPHLSFFGKKAKI